jgi:protein-disulfide isomerase
VVLPKVYEEYVLKEKLELIFLDLPLQMHPYAFKAAEAAACADDQKAFWYMHGTLFANQQALASDRLPAYAEELGLDVEAFQKCLSSGQHAGAIREDMRTLQVLGITGTPAFLLGRRVPGGDKVEVLEIVKGLPPYEVLKEKLDALLALK